MKTLSFTAAIFLSMLPAFGTGNQAILDSVIGKWTPRLVERDFKTISLEIKSKLKATGRYDVLFNHSHGQCGLDIASVELLANDKSIATDQHEGFAGGNPKDNVYQLEVKKIPTGKVVLKIKFKGSGGTDTHGEIVFKQYIPLLAPESSKNEIISGVVPAPRHWKEAKGTFSPKGARIFIAKKDRRKLLPLTKLFKQELKNAKLESYKTTTSNTGKLIIFKIAKLKSSKNREAYKIVIGNNITITGNTETGVFYGTRTLLQMLVQRKESYKIPRGTIIDWPQYETRSMLLDVGRTPFPLPVLYDYLRMMSYYKMNELHLHLNDDLTHGKEGSDYSGFRVECKTFPELTSKDLFYTQKEIRKFVKDAKRMGITVMPEFDMPGHARAFTKIWPELIYKEGGTKPKKGYLDFTNPKAVRRLKLVLDEMIPLFDSPDIHIGTDEFRVGGWPNGKEFLALNDALMNFINDMNKHIRSKGKNMRIWYGTDHIKSKIKPDKTVILDIWNLNPKPVANVTPGHRFINSCEWASYIVPGVGYYGVNKPLVYETWNPWNWGRNGGWNKSDATSMNLKNREGLMGGKLNVWMDIGPGKVTMDYVFNLIQPSLQVYAEKLWGIKGSENYDNFKNRAANKLPIPPQSDELSK